MKKFFEVLYSIIKGIFVLVGSIFFVSVIKDDINAKESSEEKENELKEKDASDIVADSPNQSVISESINSEQEELRQRIRARLHKDL